MSECGCDSTNFSSALRMPSTCSEEAEDLVLTNEFTENGDPVYAGKDGKQGIPGKSAYEVWLDAGNVGSVEDFLALLKGDTGEPGEDGTDGVDGVGQQGIPGKSAYQMWLDAGYTGTLQDFINFLRTDASEVQEGIEEAFIAEVGQAEFTLTNLINSGVSAYINGVRISRAEFYYLKNTYKVTFLDPLDEDDEVSFILSGEAVVVIPPDVPTNLLPASLPQAL